MSLKKYAEDERINTPKTKILKKIVILFNYGDECKVTKDSLRKQETLNFVNLDDPFSVPYRNSYNGKIQTSLNGLEVAIYIIGLKFC